MTLETGLPDFHKMTLTVMNVFYKKTKANHYTTYRSYKNFSNEIFMADVQNRISQVTPENNDLEFDLFQAVLNEAIQKHAPIKRPYVRANQVPFINKTINKEIMKRSRLRNKFLNTKSDIFNNISGFFNNISTRDIIDHKTFCKKVNLYLKIR